VALATTVVGGSGDVWIQQETTQFLLDI
jgi:hypothetical protein